MATPIPAPAAALVGTDSRAAKEWYQWLKTVGDAALGSALIGSSGHLHGLTLSNNGADAINDIDFAAGKCRDSTDVTNLSGTAMTKQLDAAWAAGSGAGGRMSAAAIANTTYHCFAIYKHSDGSVDYGFDVSATAPTMPAGYTYFRRIGSILREAGAIVAFTQFGDVFKRAAATDRSSTAAAASALLALSVPTGIVVAPILNFVLAGTVSVTCTVTIGSAVDGSANIGVIKMQTGVGDSVDNTTVVVPSVFYTNTSAQIYFAQTNTAGTPSVSILLTIGWIDTRGRLA